MTGRLIANDVDLDLKESVSFPFNYRIADIKDPEKRKRNFSRSVSLPGTVNNMAFFSSTYQLSLSTVGGTSIAGFNFDPTVRIPAKYYSDGGSLEFNGLLQLNEVILENGDYRFVCTLFSNFIELYMALGDMKLSELGWSEYDHALTRTNVKNSWNTSVKVNGVDTPNFTAGVPDGFGYHYGLVDYGFTRQAPKTFKTNDLAPMIYGREVLMKCLEIGSITPDSTFIDTPLFKSILIAWGGGDKPFISPAEIAKRRVEFGGNFNTELIRSGINVTQIGTNTYATFIFNSLIRLIRDDVLTTTVVTDQYNQYSPASGVVTIERSGTYKLNFSQTVQSVVDGGDMTYSAGTWNILFIVRKNGAIIASPGAQYSNGTISALPVALEINMACEAGDSITVDLSVTSNLTYQLSGGPSTLRQLSVTFTDSPDLSFTLTSTQSTLNDGDTVELSRFIPDMKAADAFTALVTMFNLYISDPDIDGVSTVEPLFDFYQPTNTFDDWTQLLDHSKPQRILPSSMIEGKFYKYKWAEDNDYDNKRYRDRFGIGYGDYTYEVESTWKKGDRVYQLPFAQTIPTDELTPLVVPRIISYDEQTGIKKPFKGKPRIFMLNGLKAGAWRFTNVAVTTNPTTYEDLTAYPAVHHFLNFQAPTFDLNWGLPQELQYTTNVITNLNLFSRYHRDFVLDITGKDSKILRASFKLNSSMIEKMDFGKLKMINGVLFRLNEIVDFESTNNSTTECELVKIVAAKKPKTFISLTTTKPAKKEPPRVVSPVGAAGVSASTGVVRGGRNDALATTGKFISR